MHLSLGLLTIVTGLLALSPVARAQEAVDPPRGRDVVEVFARAARGAPLRYVALGGSITQAGNGWIGPWLREQFPRSTITTVNSGMSATGSDLGVFRIDRDVIAYQPDLVAIEFCVNDGGQPDETVLRNIESLVVRLKRLAHPPAIVIIEAAARDGVNLQRHRRVARHYGLLEIDLQRSVDAFLQREGKPWDALFKDIVHPTETGHALYAAEMARIMQPLVDEARAHSEAHSSRDPLPAPLSDKPLLLDGRLIALAGIDGWESHSRFPCRNDGTYLQNSSPENTLTLNLRGTTFGLFYEMNRANAAFYVSIDEQTPHLILPNTRGGTATSLFARDIPAGEHRLRLVLPNQPPRPNPQHGPVKLIWALVAGESHSAPAETAPTGAYTTQRLRQITFGDIPVTDWRWAGPYATANDGRDQISALQTAFPPEAPENTVAWQPVTSQEKGWINLRQPTGGNPPGIFYASGEITVEKETPALVALAAEYYITCWINGQPLAQLNEPHGPARAPRIFSTLLRPGKNRILVKVAARSEELGFLLWIARDSAR